MRPFGIISGLVVLLALGRMARAENALLETAITAGEVEVRSLPSNASSSYPTSKLYKGASVVIVERRSGGWLAIKPPPGSFSWINTRYIALNRSYGTVMAANVPVFLGSQLSNREPDIKQVELAQGTLVVILNTREAVSKNGATFLPIQPPTQEVRFIPEDAVKPLAQVQTVPAPLAQSTTISPPVLASAPPSSIQTLPTAAYPRTVVAAAPPPVRPLDANFPQVHVSNQVIPVSPSGNLAAWTPVVPGTSHYTYQPDTASAVSRPSATATVGYAPALGFSPSRNPAPVSTSVGPGNLRRSYVKVDGNPIYALVDEKNRDVPMAYAIPQAGLTLEPFVNQNVSLYGTVIYRGDLRFNLITVTHVGR